MNSILVRRLSAAALAVAVWILPPSAEAWNNGLARTPPMGWNSWNKFHCGINETTIKQTADAMVASGMRDAGYVYLTVDDCWSAMTRDASGNLRADPTDFPGGMRALGDYIHARGLKFGIYASIGTATCTGKTPGSLNNEARDVRTFATWGADYIKADRCHADGLDYKMIYTRWRDAIIAAGRPMVLSASVHGFQSPWLWAPEVSHQWRLMGDISDNWLRMLTELDRTIGKEPYAGPGGWNDPDMLEVGNGGMTDTEYRFHFGMWSMVCAPLLAGNDVRSMSAATKNILLHPEIIAVNQDPVGYQARKVWDNGAGLQIFNKVLQGTNVRAVALANRSAVSAGIRVSWSQIGIPTGNATVRDLWARADRGTFSGSYAATVPAHGVVILRVVSGSGVIVPTPTPTPTPTPGPTPTPCTGCTFGGYYRIMARHSGKAVVVQSASTAEGANIFQYAYGGTTTNDEWAIVDVGSGYYRITNRHSGKSAEVAGGGTADGANVDQRTYGGQTYQQFQLVSVP